MVCSNNFQLGGEEILEPVEIKNIEEVINTQELNQIKNKVNEINIKINKNISDKNKEKIEAVNEQIEEINLDTNSNIPSVKNTHVNQDKLMEPIGILDPEGKEPNPLTNEPYQNLYTEALIKPNTYVGYADFWKTLPVYEQREEFIQTIYDNQCILLTAGTGSGKTVLVPKFLLHTLNYQGKIAVTIPRKAATKGAADFAAKTLDVKLGEQVGYMVKDDKKVSPNSNLVYATDGYILAKMKGGDPMLEEYDALIIDEAHERNINIDQILFLSKNILKNRPEFKLIIMSATIDPKLFLDYFKEFNIVHLEADSAPNFPVEEIFLKTSVNKTAPNGEILGKEYIDKAVEIMFEKIIKLGKPGDILALFPGKGDCDEACQKLGEAIRNEMKKNEDFKKNIFCIQLTSASGKKMFRNADEEKYAVGNVSYRTLDEYKDYTNENVEKGNIRRVVMATEVAESAITLKGDIVDWVVDTGLANNISYYPQTEIEALEKKYIAVANHKQRIGRTGRLREGTCYNIFTEDEYKKFLPYPIAPIMTSDITDIILAFTASPNITHIDIPFKYPKTNKNNTTLGDESLNSFLGKMIEPPNVEYVSNAIKKLFLINAIQVNGDKANITDLGKAINSFRDLSVQKSASVIESYNYKCSQEVIEIMALLQEIEDKMGNLIMQPKGKKDSFEFKEKMKDYEKKLKKLSSPYGDHITLYNIIKKYKEKNFNIRYERGREFLEAKGTGEGAQWARENYLNAKKLKNVMQKTKDIRRYLGRVIIDYRRDNPESTDYIYRDNAPTVHDKIEDNIMQAITEGFIGNIVKKAGRNYKTCFPEVQSVADPDRDSLFKYVSVKPSTCLYSLFISIFGRKKFLVFSKVPVKVIANLNPGEKEEIKKCEKSAKAGNKSKGKQNKKSFKKGRGKGRGKDQDKGMDKGRGKKR